MIILALDCQIWLMRAIVTNLNNTIYYMRYQPWNFNVEYGGIKSIWNHSKNMLENQGFAPSIVSTIIGTKINLITTTQKTTTNKI